MAYSGKYRPKFPKKYKGNPNNIVWRSTWELRMFKYLDLSSSVVEWGSEEVIIPYKSPVDGKIHRYFVDLFVKVKQKDGTNKTFLVEVKPFHETQKPKQQKHITENYKQKVYTYLTNIAKWEAANSFCEEHGLKFMVLTEKQIF